MLLFINAFNLKRLPSEYFHYLCRTNVDILCDGLSDMLTIFRRQGYWWAASFDLICWLFSGGRVTVGRHLLNDMLIIFRRQGCWRAASFACLFPAGPRCCLLSSLVVWLMQHKNQWVSTFSGFSFYVELVDM